MRNVLVTGASGLLGGHVVKHLLNKDCHIIVSILPSEKDTYQSSEGIDVIFNDAIFEGKLPHIDAVVNCAFARSNNPEHLADAIDFTQKLIEGYRLADVDGVINISSQGVYKRLPVGEMSNETSPIEPIDLYSMAKYAVEKTFEVAGIKHVTNIRLASINMKQRFLYKFVQNVKQGLPIEVNSPNHYASIMDVEDAAEALSELACIPAENWAPIYNLGIGKQYTLLEYAEVVQKVGNKLGYNATIAINDNGYTNTAGMDNSLLIRDTLWKPMVSNEQMIEKIYTWQ